MPIKIPLRVNFKRSSSTAPKAAEEDDARHYSTLSRVFRRVKKQKSKPKESESSKSIGFLTTSDDIRAIRPISTNIPSIRAPACTVPAKLNTETVSTSSGCHSDDGKTVDSNQTSSTKKSFTSKTSNHRKKDLKESDLKSSLSSTPSPPQHLISSGYARLVKIKHTFSKINPVFG